MLAVAQALSVHAALINVVTTVVTAVVATVVAVAVATAAADIVATISVCAIVTAAQGMFTVARTVVYSQFQWMLPL